jgi:DNA-directed RNA polymerase specialized sigma24 family protein
MDDADRRAFHAYVRERSPALLRTAYLLVGDRGEAEDLFQDALARLLNAWSRIRDAAALGAYVRRTMLNLRTSRWRSRRVALVPVAAITDHVRSGTGTGRDERCEGSHGVALCYAGDVTSDQIRALDAQGQVVGTSRVHYDQER